MADNDAGTIDFELVSPAQLLVSEPVDMVVVPGSEGDIGVLPGHSPLIASLRPGVIEIYKAGSVEDHIFVGGGLQRFLPHVVPCWLKKPQICEISIPSTRKAAFLS